MKRTAEDAKWSRMIRERAGFRCEKCGHWHAENSRGLHAAHIFSRRINRTRHDLANGVALCTACHFDAHAHPLDFHAWARKKIGARKYDALELRARRVQ